MTYRLDLGEPLAEQLQARAADQLRAAMTQLDAAEPDRAVAVRQARKSIKKARAALRLARTAMPKPSFRAHDRALRDAGRALAPLRDADMLGPAVDRLAATFAGRVPAATFEAARAAVAHLPQAAGCPSSDGAAAMSAARAAVERSLAGVPGWPVAGCDADAVVAGCARSYGRGRAAWRAARRGADGEELHEWRKAAKELWYHERLLRGAWPALLDAQIAEVKHLSDVLGDEHDLAVLAPAVAEEVPDLLPLIAERRAMLAEQADASGRRIYAERPRAFERRVRALVRAAR
ncbi:MAG TPA: CHAD domain-containing protein [Baekduia sp.]|nr:CHAD domain-containing protein [Baekduia sp.]